MYDGEIVFEVMSSNAQEANTAEASLNGHCVPVRRGVDPGDIHARQYLYSTIRILGFSCTDSVFNQEAPSLTQTVTIGVSGLVTSFNTGIDVIHSGQAIRAIPPLRGQDQAPKRGAKPGSGSRRVMSTTNAVKTVVLDHPDVYLFWYSALDQLSGYVGTSQSRGLVREQMDILATPPMRPYWKECHVERGEKKGSKSMTSSASLIPGSKRVRVDTAIPVATNSVSESSSEEEDERTVVPFTAEIMRLRSMARFKELKLASDDLDARYEAAYKAAFHNGTSNIVIEEIAKKLNMNGIDIAGNTHSKATPEQFTELKVAYDASFAVRREYRTINGKIEDLNTKISESSIILANQSPNFDITTITNEIEGDIKEIERLLKESDKNTGVSRKFELLAARYMPPSKPPVTSASKTVKKPSTPRGSLRTKEELRDARVHGKMEEIESLFNKVYDNYFNVLKQFTLYEGPISIPEVLSVVNGILVARKQDSTFLEPSKVKADEFARLQEYIYALRTMGNNSLVQNDTTLFDQNAAKVIAYIKVFEETDAEDRDINQLIAELGDFSEEEFKKLTKPEGESMPSMVDL